MFFQFLHLLITSIKSLSDILSNLLVKINWITSFIIVHLSKILFQWCKYMEKFYYFQIFKELFFEREVGFKPTTFRLEIWHSNQLNYSRKWSGKRDSDARPQPWQGCTLTNWATSAYSLIYKYKQLLKSSSFQLCKYMEKFR